MQNRVGIWTALLAAGLICSALGQQVLTKQQWMEGHRKWAEAQGQDFNPAWYEAYFVQLDVNGNGTIEPAENTEEAKAIAVKATNAKQHPPQVVVQGTSKDEWMASQERWWAEANKGQTFDPTWFNHFFEILDANGDGILESSENTDEVRKAALQTMAQRAKNRTPETKNFDKPLGLISG